MSDQTPPTSSSSDSAAPPASVTTAATTAEHPVTPVPETAVPPGETPAATCPYCGRPFRAEREATLHVGQRHPERATEAETEAYAAAHEAESDDLFVFHLKVWFALGGLYAAFIVASVIAFS